jgi:hypothetical protein
MPRRKRIQPRPLTSEVYGVRHLHPAVPEAVGRIFRLVHPDHVGHPPSVEAARYAFKETFGVQYNDKSIGREVVARLRAALTTGEAPTTSWEIILAHWLTPGGGGRTKGALRDGQRARITHTAWSLGVERAMERAGTMEKGTLVERVRHIGRRNRKRKGA